MSKQDKLTPGQEEDKKEHRKQLKAMDKAIFHSGPNRANPWAKKKPVGESMTFLQHLLAEGRPERPTTMSHQEKTQLMELLSKAFVVSQVTDIDTDIIYQMANELSDVLDKLPEGDEEERNVYNNPKPAYKNDPAPGMRGTGKNPDYDFPNEERDTDLS